MKRFLCYTFFLVSFLCVSVYGQSSKKNKNPDAAPRSIYFDNGVSWREDQAQELFKEYLDIDGLIHTMELVSSTTTKNGITVKRYNQYFKGVKVMHGTYTLTCKNGMVAFITGNFYKIESPTATTPTINEGDALNYALSFVGAEKYMWEDLAEERRIQAIYHKPDTTFRPKGRLCMVEDRRGAVKDGKVHLAWMFSVYAQQPLSRQEVYVDAATGKILFSNPLIKHTTASGHTKYSGVVNFQTSDVGATYQLYDSLRGSGVHTLNMNNGSSYAAATTYTSVTNTWPLLPADTIALDAHWGAAIVYDYLRSEQSRLSYDNLDGILLQYVHYNTNFNNAFWNGSEMTYGDGSGCSSGFTALASLDVTAHEIGHGVCQFTCDLVYEMESGAMNEAFSDCWGATIEAWAGATEVDAVAKMTWAMGEEIDCGTPLRRMDFPKLRSDPDTYGGTYWVNQVGCVPSSGNDNCGVHTNSGVMNKWYYLVVNGGTGTNDLTNAYNITGIGFTDAANILYQTELVLTSTADYNDMRTASINTAIVLFGACSQQVITVTNAWYAVGVGPAYVPFPANITGVTNICIGGTTLLSDATPGGTWASTFPVIATVSGGGLVTGINPGIDTIIYSVGSGCDAKAVVTVDALPAAAIIPGASATICVGGSALLTASPSGHTYQWKLGGANIPGATNSIYNAAVAGNYTLQASSSIGCSAISAVTVVTVSPSPPAIITVTGPTTFCAGGSTSLDANPGAGFSYQWQLGGSDIIGATNIFYTATAGGSYTAVVTNAAGCSTTSPGTAITVSTVPAATITAGGPTTFCTPGSVMLNANTGAALTYQWRLGGVSIPGATNPSFSASTAGSYSVIVGLGACSATSASTTVSVLSAMPGTIGGPSAVCIGQTISLTNSVPAGTWTSSNPATGVINSLGIVTGLSTGTTTITYTVTNMCGTGYATKGVSVSAGITVAPITGTLSVCPGGNALLTSATPGGTWSSNNTSIATVGSTTGLVSGVAAGTATISYNVTSPMGCVSSITTVMSVVPSFTASISAAGPTTFCTGAHVILNASAGSGMTYQWKRTGINISGATAAAYMANTTGNYTVLATAAGGCNATSAGIIVTVNPGSVVVPGVVISATPGTLFCTATSPATFTALPTLIEPSPSYQWYVNSLAVGTGPTYSYTPTVGDVVQCVLTSSNICAFPFTATTRDTIKVTTPRTPFVSINPGKPAACTGDMVTYSAIPVYGGATPSYAWTENGIFVGGGPTFSYRPTNGDRLVVTMTSNYPCVTIPTVNSASYTVSVQPILPHTVSIHVSSMSITAGAADTFVAIAPYAGSSPAYQWYINGLPIAGATNSMYIAYALMNGHEISCYVTSSNPCVYPPGVHSSGVKVQVFGVGVQPISKQGNRFSLIPNPNKGMFVIEGTLSTYEAKVNITITNLLGQTVHREVADVHDGILRQNIILEPTLANGTYLVSITTESEHSVFHMVLNK
ncbi:MAG: C-terminal target protein [Flavipsychrobacter sp.]|jgi:Zn-dependent metalloprotease|nr:C-terminal target protein [Flavipsychrobacter sp.]